MLQTFSATISAMLVMFLCIAIGFLLRKFRLAPENTASVLSKLDPQYIRHFRTTGLRIHCDRESPINLDGELRTARTVDISLAEEKLRFFYPKVLSRTKAFV